MESRKLFIWVGVAVIGTGIVVGVVLYLRYLNAPDQQGIVGNIPTSQPSATRSTSAGASQPTYVKVRPFVPLDQTPKEAPYVEGNPPPSQSPKLIPLTSDGLLIRTP